jgi:hypothetical protein
MNPGDSPTRWPDFVPKDKESKIQPCLLLEEEGSLQLRSSLLLDQEENNIDIREVVLDSLVPNPDSPDSTLPAIADTDLVFCPPSKKAVQLLISAYQTEPPDPKEILELESCDGFWWVGGRVFVPQKMRSRILKEFHNTALASHPGQLLKLLEVVSRTYTWPRIGKDVVSYTTSCFSCQKSKHLTQRPLGLMNSLNIPAGRGL